MIRRLIFVTALVLSTVAAGAEESTPQPPSWATAIPNGTRGPTNNGFPLVDPSENVKALSDAAAKRQDDLRAAFERSIAQQLKDLEVINDLRFTLNKELREASTARIDAEMKLRAEFSLQLSIAEAKRIDAIRAVDVNAVAVASQRASDQATVLATQVAQSAEALRGLVATTANTVAASQQQLANTLSARITTLEQAGYQQAGAKTFQDPAFIALVAEVKALAVARVDTAGIGTGRSEVIGWIIGALGAFVALIVFMMSRTQHAR